MKRNISLVLGAIIAVFAAVSFWQTDLNLCNRGVFRLPAVHFLKGSIYHLHPIQPKQSDTKKIVYPGRWSSQTDIQEKCL